MPEQIQQLPAREPEQSFQLSDNEKARLERALLAGFSIPLIDDVEDYIWESLFHYVKDIPLADPITEGRKKLLFDAVAEDGRGWSLKTILWQNLTADTRYEFVIQRADIFKKATDLGFPQGLTINSDTVDLGKALIRHWNAKLLHDAEKQNVTDPRFAILIKSRSRKSFVYVESPYPPLQEEDFEWKWSQNQVGVGLQGWKDGKVFFKWYANQKQFFEVREIQNADYRFELDWTRRSLDEFISLTANS